MNCEESRNLITISVYGKLTASERDQLKAHLRECSRCAHIFDKAAKLSHLFNEKEYIPLPDKEKSWQIISTKTILSTQTGSGVLKSPSSDRKCFRSAR
jgi:predicted anti-sigma-YlaC factor YlaD